MGNPLQTIPNLPPVIGLDGAEQLWVNQAGVDKRTTTGRVAALLLGVGGGGGGGLTAATYADLRNSAYPVVPGAFTPVITLTDPFKPGLFVPAIPAPPGQAFNDRDNGGTVIVDANGQAWQRVYDERINASWFYNEPSGNHYFGDNSGVAITAADIAANPQWIGMPDGTGQYPIGTMWDYVCLQEWLYACAACRSTPLNILWNITFGSYQLNVPGYCPAGLYRINQQLMLNATGANIEFASRRGGVISWYGNNLGTDATRPGFLMNSLAYSQIRNLTFQDAKGCQTCLVSIDHQTGYPGFVGGLSPQLNTFENWFIGGSYGNPCWGGIGVALAGGAAQGDTQLFLNIFVGSCQNGVVLGGDNAIGVTFIGGNLTNCTRGIANIGAGSFSSMNLLTEGDTYNYYGYPHADQLTMDGADFVSSEVGTESSLVIGNRSESMVFAIDTNYLLEVQTSAIAYAGVSSWQPNAHFHRGYGISVAGNGFTVAVLADDGGPPWFMGTLDATSTIISVPVLANGQPPNWAVNQWAGWGIWLRYGSNGYCSSNGVVSNTANTITLAVPYPKGLTYPLGYRLFSSGGPTAPNWGAVPTTAYGRVTRNASGYQWTTLVGSSFVQGPPPPVGAWVMVCGADNFNLQQINGGSPAMPGPLFGKVASATNAASFQGYVTGLTLTVVSITGAGVIAIGTAVSGGGNIVKQLTGPAGGVGTYQLDVPNMYPVSAQFWGHISVPGTLVVEQAYSGQIAVGQTLAASGINGTPTITGVLSQAAFTARIDNGAGGAGNTLTVTALASGALAIGQTLFGPGIPTGAAAPTITLQSSGTPGGVGTYGIGGGTLQVASEAMTSATTGAGSYSISDSTQTTTRTWMETGIAGTQTAMITTQGFSLVDNAGNPVNAGVAITNGMGYWGQPILDQGAGPAGTGLTWIPVDFDVLYGVKRARGVQMIALGKASHVGELEFDYASPQNLLSANYLRDAAIGVQPVNYRPSPDIGLAAPWQPMNANPYTMTVGGAQIGTTKALYFYVPITAVTLNMPVLQPNLAMDVELILESWAATPPVITWGANVRAAAPTLTLGASGQLTIVRLKWWGTINTGGGPTSSWLVTGIQGPL